VENEIPDGLIEIHDPEVDVDQIMTQIRERVHRRREEAGYPRQDLLAFGAAAYPGELEGEGVDADLYYHLRKANDLYHQVSVDPLLAPSPASRLPILGRLWRRMRQEAHNLVLYYVGRQAGRQVMVNRHLVSTLNRMAVQLQRQQEELEALRNAVGERDA